MISPRYLFLIVGLAATAVAMPPKAEPKSEAELAASAKAPAGAHVLFDGTSLDAWQPTTWKLVDNAIEVTPKGGSLVSRANFGSIRLHLEWRAPLPVTGEGQGRGNSGVFLMGIYELQVLDNWNNTTGDTQCAGAIYKQSAPLVDPCRPPGEWNHYDIEFRRPVFNADGTIARAARMTVHFNGVLVQDNFELPGIPHYKGTQPYNAHADALPLTLQDHGNPVRFRNIWVVPLKD